MRHDATSDNIGPDTQKDIFKGGPAVTTLQAEVDRVQKKIRDDIATAAQDAGKGAAKEAQKRQLLGSYLFPLAVTAKQVEMLDEAIRTAPKDTLDGLLTEAAKRRMLADVLLPLEANRPEDQKDKTLTEIVALKAAPKKGLSEARFTVPTDKLFDLLEERIGESVAEGATRDTIEKRHAVAFVLFALSQAKTPGE